MRFRWYSQLRRAHKSLQRFSAKLLETQERERRTLAHELHEEMCQALAAIKINLQGLQKRSPATQLDDCIQIVDGIMLRASKLSLELWPPQLNELGLEAAVRAEIARRAGFRNVNVELCVDTGEARLSQELETTCFRVIQEALENAERHAHARNLWVTLAKRNEELELTISDDGKGFDVPAARENAAHGEPSGLSAMLQRVHCSGGDVDIQSSASLGTEIRVILPLRSRVRDTL